MKTYQLSLFAIAMSAMMFTSCSEQKAETTISSSETADTTALYASENDSYNLKSEEDVASAQKPAEDTISEPKSEEDFALGQEPEGEIILEQKSEEDVALNQKTKEEEVTSEKKSKEVIALKQKSANEVVPNQEPTIGLDKKKIIKTADLRCKVTDVQDATNHIEDVVEKYDGYVTHAELETRTFQNEEVEISEDSVLHNRTYEITNSITIRVPSRYFEKVLREIQPIMVYIDHQNIAADDVSASLLATELSKKRFSKFEDRYAKEIDKKGKKLKETTTSEEKLLELQTQADMNKVQALSLKDQINYSTLTIELYQPMANTVEVLANTDNRLAVQPSFFARFSNSLQTGWFFIEDILIFFATYWFFILIALGGYWIYKTYAKSVKE